MKKLLFLVVVASLLMFVSPAAWTMAQDPDPESTAQPTEQPAAAPEVTDEPPAAPEPTEEPAAAAPTEEPPAAEPTEEAAPTEEVAPTEEAAPTEEPTAEPTEEVVPTEEPTTEPTEEVVPTEEPTAEPTEEVVPTEEPTAEPTEEPVLTVTPEVTATLTATPVPVSISHVAIRDAADGLGSMVYTYTMTVGEEFTVYAAGYDADGNYLWDVPVDWALTGSLVQEAAAEEPAIEEEPVIEEPVVEEEPVAEPTEEEIVASSEVVEDGVVAEEEMAPEATEEPAAEDEIVAEATDEPTPEEEDDSRTTSFTFVPTAEGEGTIVADDGNGHAAATDLVTVLAAKPKAPEISHIVIRDAAEGMGSQVITATLLVSDTYAFYAAAYDAEGNYLKDVPADWTTTGTLDPVTATQAISLTFTPLTAATTGTILADGGDGRSDETGEILVIEGNVVQSDIEGQALTGSWTTQIIGVQNLSASNEAEVIVSLYNGGTDPAQVISSDPIPALGNVQIGSSEISEDGSYGAVVSSNELVAVAVLNRNDQAKAADIYAGMGTSDVATTLYAPMGTRLWGTGSAWNSMVHVQNVSSTAQDVQMNFYEMGSTSVFASKTIQDLAAYDSATIDFATDSAFSGKPKAMGYIELVGLGGGDIAAAVEQYRNYDVPDGALTMMTAAVPSSTATLQPVVSMVLNNWGTGKWQSAVNILNLGDSDATVTAVFTKGSSSSVDGTTYGPFTIGAKEVYNLHLAEKVFGQTAKFLGSCQFDSNQPILAVVTTNSYGSDGSYGQSWLGVSGGQAMGQLAAPLIFRDYQGWTTATQVYNFGDAATLRMRFIKSPDCTVSGWDDFTWDQAVGSDSGANFHMNERPSGSVPTGWYGAAYVETVPYDAGAQLMAVVTNSCYSQSDANAAAAYPAIGY